jgi:hypothetical protein
MPPITLAAVALVMICPVWYAILRLAGMSAEYALAFATPLLGMLPPLELVIRRGEAQLASRGSTSQFVKREGRGAHQVRLALYWAIPLVLVPQMASLAYGALELTFLPYLFTVATISVTAYPVGAIYGTFANEHGRGLALLSVVLGATSWAVVAWLGSQAWPGSNGLAIALFAWCSFLFVAVPAAMFGYARGQKRGVPSWVDAVLDGLGIGDETLVKLFEPPAGDEPNPEVRRAPASPTVKPPGQERSQWTAAEHVARCAACGHENPSTSTFCTACGNSLAIACRRCGGEFGPGHRFCASCGAPRSGSAEDPSDHPRITLVAAAPNVPRDNGMVDLALTRE